MEPLTMLISALLAGAAAATKDLMIPEVKEGYSKLKSLILRKFGDKGDVSGALERVERKLDSPNRQTGLKKELEESGAALDSEVLEQARNFLVLLEKHGFSTGSTYKAELHGDGAIAQGQGGVATGQGSVAVSGNCNTIVVDDKIGNEEFAVVKIFFATDRNLRSSSRPNKKFGSLRSELSYGTCDVSIPRDRRMGELEAPSIWRLEWCEDPKKHIVIQNISVQLKQEFFSDLSLRVRSSRKFDAFIFIHGYNVTFEKAAKRTAQMAYDLGFDGAPVFYSWPSTGSISNYPIDESNIEWAQTNLKAFLEDFLCSSKAENIFLIAHSMGNRALTRAFTSLIMDNPKAKQRFREVILTAPDIDAEVFKRDIAPVMTKVGQAVTLYVSSKDVALVASKKVHGYPRAGDSGQGLVLVPGIETIDASNVDTSFLGHSYFAEARSVLADIFNLIRYGHRADQRFGLRPVEMQGTRYWVFKQ